MENKSNNYHIVSVTLELGEFERAFPEIAKRGDLNKSDKIRLALGLDPRRTGPGAPKGNKNAVGNVGRWNKNKTNLRHQQQNQPTG